MVDVSGGLAERLGGTRQRRVESHVTRDRALSTIVLQRSSCMARARPSSTSDNAEEHSDNRSNFRPQVRTVLYVLWGTRNIIEGRYHGHYSKTVTTSASRSGLTSIWIHTSKMGGYAADDIVAHENEGVVVMQARKTTLLGPTAQSHDTAHQVVAARQNPRFS